MYISRRMSSFCRILRNSMTKTPSIKNIHVGASRKKLFLTSISLQNLERSQAVHIGCQLKAEHTLENEEDFDESDSAHDSIEHSSVKRDNVLLLRIAEYIGTPPVDRALLLEECQELRLDCIQCTGSEQIVDGCLMKCFLAKSQLLAGYSYAKFLAEENLFNPASIVLAAQLFFNSAKLGVIDESFIFKFYDEILNGKFAQIFKLSVLPHFYCLAATSRWKEAVELFNSNQKGFISGSNAPSSTYTLILVTCIIHGQLEMALAELQKWAKNEKTRFLEFSYEFHEIFLNCLVKKSIHSPSEALKNFTTYAEVMGKFCSQEMPAGLEPIVRRLFENIDPAYRIIETKIGHRNLTCPCCVQKVEVESFTPKEYEIMKLAVMGEILHGDDVFRQSSPGEITMFRKFMVEKGPFDLVFDGLNVVIGGKGWRLGSDSRLRVSINTMSNMARITNARKICIVLRAHLIRRIPECSAALNKLGCVLTLGDKTSDDPFILYSALASGPRAYVVSKDHFSFLADVRDQAARQLLMRWKRTRVIKEWDENGHGNLKIKVPPNSARRYQTNGTSFHIPLQIHDNQEPLSDWLCISRHTE